MWSSCIVPTLMQKMIFFWWNLEIKVLSSPKIPSQQVIATLKISIILRNSLWDTVASLEIFSILCKLSLFRLYWVYWFIAVYMQFIHLHHHHCFKCTFNFIFFKKQIFLTEYFFLFLWGTEMCWIFQADCVSYSNLS